jgi:hypothetical protein
VIRRANAIPLADVDSLRRAHRRSLVVRATSLAVIVGLVAWLAAATRSPSEAAPAPRATTSTIVLLDVSGSIGSLASATIVRTLRSVARQGGNAGLVLFSDDVEEALPPSAPASMLRDYAKLFVVRRTDFQLMNPWANTLSSGTQIGKGMDAAREALRRAGIAHGRVILVSDLQDSGTDAPRMRRSLLAYARDPGIRLHVAVVPGYSPGTERLFRTVLGHEAVAIGRPPAAPAAIAASGGAFPLVPLVLALAAAVALAAYELANAPLVWREAAA